MPRSSQAPVAGDDWQAGPMAVLGVDGWRGAWVGALLCGRTVRLLALADVPAVLAVPEVEVVAVDMPIGLSDHGVRACDVAARALLGPAGGSVFPAPVRAVLATDDYAEGRALSRAATDPPRAPSAQAFRLVRSIRALDDASVTRRPAGWWRCIPSWPSGAGWVGWSTARSPRGARSSGCAPCGR